VKLPVGAVVGARRWPYEGAHPAAWGRPWRGVVLAEDDPRAWANTLAFPRRTPSRDEVRAHIEALQQAGLQLDDRQPVLWEFGAVCWEPVHRLRPYEDDLAEWEAARAEAITRYAAATALPAAR